MHQMGVRAAVCAGLVWYLLKPPVVISGPRIGEVSYYAPFALWSQVGEFDSWAKCERARVLMLGEARKKLGRLKKDDLRENLTFVALRVAETEGRCIAFDF